MTDARKPAKSTKVFSEEERDAMKERAREQKAEAKRAQGADVEAEVLAKIAEMPGPDRVLGERLHALIKASAPDLAPRLWYGQPAYSKDGKVLCFFQGAQKFKTRYATLGFSDEASARRRHHVADLVRPDGADRRRRGKDRSAREEGGRWSLTAWREGGGRVSWTIESVREADVEPDAVFALYADPATWRPLGAQRHVGAVRTGPSSKAGRSMCGPATARSTTA